MIRMCALGSVILAVILAGMSPASAGPCGTTGNDRILCQDRPPREDDGPRRRDDRRDDLRRDDRPEPERARKLLDEMEKLRDEIGRMHEDADRARQRGDNAKAEELMKEKKKLERKLRELERQLPPKGPRPGPPLGEGAPGMPPEEVEEIKREIQRLVEEAAKAKEQGEKEKAENLMREAKGLEERLRRERRPVRPEREFSEKDIEKVMKWLKENEPETLEKLEGLRKREPGAYYHFLHEVFMKMEQLEDLKKRDPEGYKRMVDIRKLDRKIWELVEKYKHTEGKEACDKIKAELKETLSKLFDLKQAQHKAEIAELEKEVSKLKEIYKHHQENKSEILEERLKELTGKKRSFDW